MNLSRFCWGFARENDLNHREDGYGCKSFRPE